MSSVRDRLAAFEAKKNGTDASPAARNAASSVAQRIASLERRNSGSALVEEHSPARAAKSSDASPARRQSVHNLSPSSEGIERWKRATAAVSAPSNWRIATGDSPSTPTTQAPVMDAASLYEVSASFKQLELNAEHTADVRNMGPALQRCLGPTSDPEVHIALKAIGKVPNAGRIGQEEFLALVKHIQKLRTSGGGAGTSTPSRLVKNSSKSTSSFNVLKVHGAHGGTHSFAEEEKAAFARYISGALSGDPDAKAHLPINADTLDLFEKVAGGIVLCKLVNHAVRDAIDVRAINRRGKLSLFQVTENLNLAINASKAIGCHIVNIDASDILQGTPHLVLGMVWQIVKIALLSGINLTEHPQLVVLLRRDEELSSFVKLPPEQVLLRWINWHLEEAGRTERVRNFGKDVADSVAYTVLLKRIAPPHAGATLDALGEADQVARALSVVRTAARIPEVSFSITALDIVGANEKLNLAFAAALFNACPGLDLISDKEAAHMLEEARGFDHESDQEPISEEETREELAFRMWINSLGVDRFVRNLFHDTKDAVAMLQVMDRLKPGLVDWGKIKARPRTVYETVENGNYAIKLASAREGFNLSLVGIQGKDLVDGNRKYILAVIWQLMRFHILNFINLSVAGAAEQGQGAAGLLSPAGAAIASVPGAQHASKPPALTEEDVLAWANEAVARSGSKRRIDSFRDRTIKTGMFLLDLLAAVEPRCVDRAEVQPVEYDLIHGADEELCALNAKYAISCARKLGCAVFLLWEDIVDVKVKMIFTFVAAVMAKQLTLNKGVANVGAMARALNTAKAEGAASPSTPTARGSPAGPGGSASGKAAAGSSTPNRPSAATPGSSGSGSCRGAHAGGAQQGWSTPPRSPTG